MKKLVLPLFVFTILFACCISALADDYYCYGDWNLGASGNDYLTGINGYIDTDGSIEGIPGAEYIFFTSGPSYQGHHTAYVYRVDTAGDPNMHPSNPEATGPVAPRTFTLVSTHYMGYYASGHDNAFYIDDTGIYYGAANNGRYGVPGWGSAMGGGIFHWNFDWTNKTCVVPVPAPGGTQTLARNPSTGDWWVGTASRDLYKWNGSSWVFQFRHPNLAGNHHDGMEIIGNSLFISDMTSDVIIQYRLDDSGNVIDAPDTPYNTFSYTTPAYRNVEGLGYGPNKHIWISGWNSYTIYEIGGGALQVALEGIPDQCVFQGESFDTFDLDDYATGKPPLTWSWSGNVNLTIRVDAENVVTVTYPAGWCGSETVTFTVTDANGRSASDDATFKVCPVPVVGDIPDQAFPFAPFDLDDYLSGIDPAEVTWSASEPGGGWTVAIDANNVVTVTAPEGATEPVTITFTATTVCCGREASDSDDATFTPIIIVGIDIKPGSWPNAINPDSKGVIPVAILTTSTDAGESVDFDATTVDPLSVKFGPSGATEAHGKGHIEDVDGDGDLDMVLHFKTQDTGIKAGDTEACLTGKTVDGKSIKGCDAIVTVPPKGKGKAAPALLAFSLGQSFPNPPNPEAWIPYTLGKDVEVTITIYSTSGRIIRILNLGHQEAGAYISKSRAVYWDGRNEYGEKVSSGVYFYAIEAGAFGAVKKMVVLR